MENTAQAAGPRVYRPADSYYRANAAGTGSAIKFELHPAHGNVAGSVFATMAKQATPAGGEGRRHATFDWKNAVAVKFDRNEIAQILRVLRGASESVNEGRGMYHATAGGQTSIKFWHALEPRPGYCLSVRKRLHDGTLESRAFTFDEAEAWALAAALEQAMMYVCFGLPVVIERPQQVRPVWGRPEAAEVAPAEAVSL